jgi:glycosyltransferase involved in cell wall biosynthesis
MRREHALSLVARRQGIPVTFIEAPDDIRALRAGRPARFLASLGGTREFGLDDDLAVVARTVPVPGHRGRMAASMDTGLLRRILDRHADSDGPIVGNLPWQWPALSGRSGRRIFDCADDWTRLYPQSRTDRFTDLFRRIAAEADEVIVASPDLAHLFAGRDVTTVPNGADAASVAERVQSRPHHRSLVYVGTLSERFDVPLVARLLEDLPQWSLHLYGPCRYAGMDDRPAAELVGLLESRADRVHWHGTIPRSDVATAIDRADVVVVPNRPSMSEGQSSMKLYDGAARGRPVVVSPGVSSGATEPPPGTYIARGSDEWAAAVLAADGESSEVALARVAWARSNTWEQRWTAWAAGVFGPSPLVGAEP